MPLLLTRISTWPKRARVCSARSRTLSSSRRSVGTTSARRPCASTISRVSCSASTERAASTRSAPSAAYASAIARPMPRPAPVMTAILSVSNIRISPLLSTRPRPQATRQGWPYYIRPSPPCPTVRSRCERTDRTPGVSPASAALRAAPAPCIVGPPLAGGLLRARTGHPWRVAWAARVAWGRAGLGWGRVTQSGLSGSGLRLRDPLHDLFGRHRHLIDFDTERFESIFYGAGDCRRRNHAPAFAATFDAIGREGRRRLVVVDLDGRNFGRSWQQVVVKG